ncbi:DUF2059 domain-containing protein [Rhizobium sp. KVB221]|uniref:DUF2059 domain-containing protein n=1 Tax=Rhizobium setariae TaxID=2801340 RepID=A0A936YMC3_9HYPH|nr:DUF2059 domain-containing protein [Rhizobium setariae]MBL0373075.1 DUF2059 domain-containing protein [Rhizobium setariae]
MMKNKRFGGIAFGALVAAGLFAGNALAADEVTDAQIKAARAAMDAIRVTTPFDGILPTIASQLKSTLIQGSPNYEALIVETVDQKAIELAPRRADLEREAAIIYAKAFTADELNAIAAFYSSPAGQKLLKDGPLAIRELSKAGDVWAAGITRDLTKAADEELEKKIAAQKK